MVDWLHETEGDGEEGDYKGNSKGEETAALADRPPRVDCHFDFALFQSFVSSDDSQNLE